MANSRRQHVSLLLKAPVLIGTLGLGSIRQTWAASILGVRIWPAPDYTRITIELDQALSYKFAQTTNPDRLVLDLEGLKLDGSLKELVNQLQPNDPFVAAVRVGAPQNNTLRIAFDMKEAVKPQVFSQTPVGIYKHRLIIDLYPSKQRDPLEQLIAQAQGRGKGIANDRNIDPIEDLARNAEQRDEERRRERRGQVAKSDAKAEKKPDTSPASASKRMVTIALDPGHGGEDPGAVGANGTREKDVVLLIARKLRDRIEQEPLMRAYMTRDADFFVPLVTRVSKARRVRADLLVSIHADAFELPQAKGASVFILSEKGASSSSARWLANKENAADLVGGVNNIKGANAEAAKLLLSMSTESQIRDSSTVARAVLSELGSVGQLHKRQIEQANFAVLRAPDIPSMLVETAFISNPAEEKKLRDPEYQDKIANAVFKGIKAWIRKNPGTVGRVV